jgi:cysteine sulfinate desulfinase/cysteine desulfurase-like protein
MLGAERARAALRISLGEDTDEAQLDQGIRVLLSVLAR